MSESSEDHIESHPVNGNGVWRSIAISLMTFVLGMFIPLFLTRNDLTKDEIAQYLAPLQTELDAMAKQQAINSDMIGDLREQMSALSEHIKVEDGKR